jgi:F-type H+-transporting ATPase subunit b
MDINITLLGEMITFALFIWVTMKYIWPPLTKIMQERQQKIAQGLEAAERGQRDLEIAKNKIKEQLRETKAQRDAIIEQANHQANIIVEEGKAKASQEWHRTIAKAKLDVEHEVKKMEHKIQHQVADVAVTLAEKILQERIDLATQRKLIDQLIEQI